MRLAAEQIACIRQIVREVAGPDVCARLFGSRLDDLARGGDVDVLLSSPRRLDLLTRARVKTALEAALGLPVDVVAYQERVPPSPFQSIALASSRPL